jgi:predicted DNA-binding protein (UPF0251 family)/predicted Fe-Mo cluster-binding NifX family protein
MLELTEIYLPLDGLEALRLADLEGLSHEAAARKMNVSRQTFGRIISRARQSVADVLVHGYALRITGGDYVLADQKGQTDQGRRVSGDAFSLKPSQRAADTNQKTHLEESQMEKIAVTAESPNLDDLLDPRFGRAAGFIIVDPQTMEHEYVDNGESQAMPQGAGIQAAEIVARTGARVVLTGYVGPKAFQALQAAGITVGQNLEGLTVREAIARYTGGHVEMADKPNRKGHGR